MEHLQTHRLGQVFSRKNDLTFMRTTINPTTPALRRVLNDSNAKMLVLSPNDRLAQLAYDHIRDRRDERCQLIWLQKCPHDVLSQSIPQLPYTLEGVDALMLTSANKIAGIVASSRCITPHEMEKLCDFAIAAEPESVYCITPLRKVI